jgi:hypothetical protein
MPLAVSSARVARRWTRSLLSLTLALGLAGAVGACSDDDPTSPSNLSGTYAVVTYDGASAASQQIFGSMIINGSEWAFELEDPDEVLADQGTFTRSRNNLTFFSDFFDDQFPGNISGTTLTIDYNLSDTGTPDIVRIVFRR